MDHPTKVDLTYMNEPDVVIDIMDDFSLQRCVMQPQDSGTRGDAQFVIPPMLTEFQSLLSAGIQTSTRHLEKTPFFHAAAQKSCKQIV
jgi:hypothetical protein